MQAITTKFLGATNTKPARIKATSGSGISVTVSFDYGLTEVQEHAQAVIALCKKLNWMDRGPFLMGGTKDGYCAVFADSDSFEVQS